MSLQHFLLASLLSVALHLAACELDEAATLSQISSDGAVHPQSASKAIHASPERGSHMVFACHGMMGDPSDMKPLLEALQQLSEESNQRRLHKNEVRTVRTRFHNIVAHEPHTLWQRLTLTTRGVAHGGTAVAHEILTVLENNPDVTSLSLIGFSLGGMYMRLAAGLLLPLHPTSPRRPANSAVARADRFQRLAQTRVVDFNAYISIATPHVGVRGYLNPLFSLIMRQGWLGQLGRDLAWDPPATWTACEAFHALCKQPREYSLADAAALSQAPILLQMASPQGVYWRALANFRSRTAVGNEVWDRSVPYFTATLAPAPHWLSSQHAIGLGLKAWAIPATPGRDDTPLDPHFTGAWVQREAEWQQDEDTVSQRVVAWASALHTATVGPEVGPEVAQAAALRAAGGWLTVNAKWDDWLAYLLNHNRIIGKAWLTPWADCSGFLTVLSRVVAHRLQSG